MNIIMYHGTSMNNLASIATKGIKPSIEGIVYLTKKPEDAIKFPYIRGIKNILILKVKVDDSKVIETFDHNSNFFKCRCFGYEGIISPKQIIEFKKIEI